MNLWLAYIHLFLCQCCSFFLPGFYFLTYKDSNDISPQSFKHKRVIVQ